MEWRAVGAWRPSSANPSLGTSFGTPPGRPGPTARPPSAGRILGMTNLPIPTVSQMTPTFRKAEPVTALRAYLAFAVI